LFWPVSPSVGRSVVQGKAVEAQRLAIIARAKFRAIGKAERLKAPSESSSGRTA
jgi:hypothetical protein